MYPREFFDTFWRGSLRKEVFVAISFADEFTDIWTEAIRPAIVSDVGMVDNRVNTSVLSGSVITKILDGVAHATLIFADISIMKKGSWRGQRNGNVMYELGIAHAIRPPTDVVVVRNDRKEINFDVAGIQVHHYPREDAAASRALFTRLLQSALEERGKIMSIMMQQARELLDGDSLTLMWQRRDFQPFGIDKQAPAQDRLAVQRLLDMDIIRCVIPQHGHYQYVWTDFGKAVYNHPNLVPDAH
jgi:hypothetical protein